ncbi:MAG TPA: LLM class flavin-dependent oxidoreductase [Streptosporangiaceae bacterium]|nr:LLM class flavin-dependent oxidoreductase [Streptosporangiaceae bacterium]
MGAPKPLRFIWSVPGSVGAKGIRGANAREDTSGLPDVASFVEFARRAEEAGMDSVLVPIGYYRADPVTMASVMGAETATVKFMLATRSGIVSPTYFVQQVNTLAMLTNGRVAINSVAGHSPQEQRFFGDMLPHDERYRRTEEFWAICHALWDAKEPVNFDGAYYRIRDAQVGVPFRSDERTRPEIYLGGNSSEAQRVAIAQADCHLRFADAPERLGPKVAETLRAGIEVGLVVSVIVRPTRREALRAAHDLMVASGEQAREVQRQFQSYTDSVGWATAHAMAEREAGTSVEEGWLWPHLWIGLVPYLGPTAMSLVGSPEDIADGLFDFRRIGISQFVFQGRPDLESMIAFGRDVLPIVRAREAREAREEVPAPRVDHRAPADHGARAARTAQQASVAREENQA